MVAEHYVPACKRMVNTIQIKLRVYRSILIRSLRSCRGPEHNPSARDAHRAGGAAPRYNGADTAQATDTGR